MVQAVAKAVVRAKAELVRVPITNASTFPHRMDGYFGAAKVMLRPASEGTGVIAGGAVRVVLELAGIKNGFGKQLGSPNPLNNARAACVGLSQMRTLKQVAAQRDMTIEELMSRVRGGSAAGKLLNARASTAEEPCTMYDYITAEFLYFLISFTWTYVALMIDPCMIHTCPSFMPDLTSSTHGCPRGLPSCRHSSC